MLTLTHAFRIIFQSELRGTFYERSIWLQHFNPETEKLQSNCDFETNIKGNGKTDEPLARYHQPFIVSSKAIWNNAVSSSFRS